MRARAGEAGGAPKPEAGSGEPLPEWEQDLLASAEAPAAEVVAEAPAAEVAAEAPAAARKSNTPFRRG